MRDATLVILTLNELPGLRALWDRLPTRDMREIVAVDGGSTDGTREFLTARGVSVLDQGQPGWGTAAQVGIAASNTSSVAFFSPDGNQDPADIPLLLDQLDQGFDVVIASRFLPGGVHEEDGEFWRVRARGTRFFTGLATRRFNRGPALTDATNSFRVIRRAALSRLNLDHPGFAFPYQMTLQALHEGMRIGEVPTFEGQRVVGPARAETIPVGLEHLRVFLQEYRRARRS